METQAEAPQPNNGTSGHWRQQAGSRRCFPAGINATIRRLHLTPLTFIAALAILPLHMPTASAQQCLSKGAAELSFDAAKEDTRAQLDCERSTRLIAITKSNPDLIWQGDDLLVLLWTPPCTNKSSPSPACKQKGERIELTAKDNNYYYWITVAPEVRDFLGNQLSATTNLDSLRTRLKKHLGLKVDQTSNYESFVEMWVKKEDLIRPCKDTDIDDSSCELISACSASSEDALSNALRSDWPFTALGYTYDWGNPNSDIGASEFVIKRGAMVTIKQVTSFTDYIKQIREGRKH